jgi:hypothetical protein
MKRCALVFGFLAVLALPAPAFALREIMTGNQPIGPESGHDKEVLAAVNVEERVLLSTGGLVNDLDVYFKGGPKALNEAFRRFAAIPAGKREIILMPFPAKPFDLGKESYPYDWVMHIPGTRRGGGERVPPWDRVTLTVYIPNPNPPAPADPAAIRKWIADLGSNDFKTRERAAKELAAVGPSAAGLFREALRGKPTAEARERLEKLLGEVSKELQVDTLDIPAGLTVVGPDDLLARARAKLADKAGHIRGDGANQLAQCGVPAAEILPELKKLLESPAEWESHAAWGAAMAAIRLGADARPLLPALRTATGSKVEYVANMCKQAIPAIEKAKPDPVPEAEAKKRATIRKEIKELVQERTTKR